jgi:AcrR family transcriptional regulator
MIDEVQRRSRDRRDTGTRQRLIGAAQGCLRTRGLARTSSRAITEAAGANLGAITYYFGSKEHLVAVALAEELHDWTAPALDLLADPSDPAAGLLAAVNTLNATFDAQRDRAPGLLEVFVHAARNADRANPIARIWVDLRARVAAVIEELGSRRAIPQWVAPDAMAALILAVAAGTIVSATVEPDGIDHRQIASQFASLLVAAAATATSPTADG